MGVLKGFRKKNEAERCCVFHVVTAPNECFISVTRKAARMQYIFLTDKLPLLNDCVIHHFKQNISFDSCSPDTTDF